MSALCMSYLFLIYTVFLNQQRSNMARIANKKSLLNDLKGRIGKEFVVKQYTDKVVVSKYPDMSKVKPSRAQLESREKMKRATAYALSILRDPLLRAPFEEALGPGESVYHKAKKLYFEKFK